MISSTEDLKPAMDLALEIRHVVATVQGVVYGLESRRLQGQPDWLRLQVGKKGAPAPLHTVRDYIIYRHAKGNFPEEHDMDSTKVAQEPKKLVTLCRLGFDFTSNASTLQVDHFFPEKNFLEKIDSISQDINLRNNIKQALISLKQFNGKTWNDNFISKLIPPANEPMTALKCIYYNYSANLWPVSGSNNATKGARSAFQFAMDCVSSELDAMGACLDSAIIEGTMSELRRFDDQRASSHCIIPHISESGSLMTELEFFLSTPAGKAAKRICANVAKIGQIGMDLAYPLASQLQKLETRSKAKGVLTAMRIVRKVRKKVLPHPSDSVSSCEARDSSSLGSEGLDVLDITREDILQAMEKSSRKRNRTKIKSQVRDIESESLELDHHKSTLSSSLDGAKFEEEEWESDEEEDDENCAGLKNNR